MSLISQFLPKPKTPFPIVPIQSIAGRTLALLVAIMTFLSCVTFGAVFLVQNSTLAWSSEVGRELTIQLQQVEDEQMLSDIRTAISLSEQSPGVARAFELTIKDSEELLSPWLGEQFDISAFDVPRLVVVQLADPSKFDLEALEAKITDAIPEASLDTHELWQQQLNAMAGTVVLSGALALILILTATVLAIVFATAGAMASNREIVDVLHFIGASDTYIAGAFQERFLAIGMQGGAAGGAMAIVFFFVASTITSAILPNQSATQVELLFGQFTLGWLGLFGLILVVVTIAILTAITSRVTVHRFLAQIAP
ncbi:ABC transporter permease [uncultured Maritalea sp.]|uniref:cell division protein FtsX n=1 Tax=uncultured Maritalea sp. TaxID=757249 RepID=UPI00260D524A|nr:ABC transporter permease [uncultured Maritalea sp.]